MWKSSSLFYLIIVTIFLASCSAEKKERIREKLKLGIFSKKNYSEVVFASAELDSLLKTSGADAEVSSQVREFYTGREYQGAWIISGEPTTPAENFYEQLNEHVYSFRDSSLLDKDLVSLWSAAEQKRKFRKDSTAVKKLELLLTVSYFRYAEKTSGGEIKNPRTLEWYIPKKKKNFVAVLDTLVSSGTYEEEMLNNTYYALLKKYLIAYRKVEESGGLPKLEQKLATIKTGDRDQSVLALRKYLNLTGDLREDNQSEEFDDGLETAVKNFQLRYGLEATGTTDKTTLGEMNIPVGQRIRQIMLNMERLRWFSSPDTNSNYIVVNIPAFRLIAFEKNKPALHMDVVVGTTANRTTIFNGSMTQMVVNPYWNVPASILHNEMVPKLQADAGGYAASQHLEVLKNGKTISPSSVNWSDEEEVETVRIRQKPGDHNALGRLKFLFPNSFSIYLHDTPAKSLFNKQVRTFSHGCIRLADARKLASYIMRDDKSWSDEKLDAILETETETFISVKPPVKVYIVYFTAWVDQDGQLNFRDDIYGNDKRLEAELFENEAVASN